MAAFSDDPELVATFRMEVEERISSLSSGLLALESAARPRDVLTALCRDAHTVKGSARMLGLEDVVSVAHGAEDLLAALRDGRLAVRPEHVDLLLAACDTIGASLPGGQAGEVRPESVASLVAQLEDSLGRRDLPVAVGQNPTSQSGLTQSGLTQSGLTQTGLSQSGARTSPAAAPPAPQGPRAVPAAGPSPFASTSFAGTPFAVAPVSGAAPVADEPATPALAPAAPPLELLPSLEPSPLPSSPLPPLVTRPTLVGQVGEPPAAATVRATLTGHEEVRVNGRRVRALLDAVGEAELGGRRLLRSAHELGSLASQASVTLASLRRHSAALPPDAQLVTQRLTALLDQLAAACAADRDLSEDHRDRLALVRDQAIGLAMVPVRHLLSGYPRLVRGLARETGKDVRVELTGEGVELDKQVLDAVADALTHLVTNAVDHGVETAEERLAAGKPAQATVAVRVSSAGGAVMVEVSDDGRGVDVEAVRAAAEARGIATDVDPMNLLFAPALSTARTVSRYSGRGMGLDSVRTAVEGIGGSISIVSEPGRGTRFTVTVPVTLGVLRCLVVRLGQERYAIPVTAVVETLSLRECPPTEVGGAAVVVRDGHPLPLLDLAATLGVPASKPATCALVTRHAGPGALAWAVEALEGESEMVVGDLGSFLGGGVQGVSGVSIDADGRVLCVLDLRQAASRSGGATRATAATPEARAAQGVTVRRPRVLVVEDSLGVRELERAVLEAAGYDVDTAVDGSDGAARLRGEPVDLVLTDVEMPGMTGFALTRTVRATPAWANVPVVIMTSCGSEDDKRQGLQAGANAYMLKNEFDQTQLVETVRRLVGR